jgi:hypothetical protein
MTKGKMSENRGAEMCEKEVIWEGFWREKGGEKGVLGASKAGKKALLGVWKGEIGGRRVGFGPNSDNMSHDAPARSHPLRRREG